MAKRLQLRGGTEVEHSTFTGADREITVDTTNKKLRLHDGSTAGGFQIGGDLTETPIVSITVSVNENSVTGGSYTSSTGSTVSLTATNGAITNHDTVAKTFDYTAPDITDGDNDTDVITANATKAGELISKDGLTNITVVYVPMVDDDAISNASFTTNEETNDGFTY